MKKIYFCFLLCIALSGSSLKKIPNTRAYRDPCNPRLFLKNTMLTLKQKYDFQGAIQRHNFDPAIQWARRTKIIRKDKEFLITLLCRERPKLKEQKMPPSGILVPSLVAYQSLSLYNGNMSTITTLALLSYLTYTCKITADKLQRAQEAENDFQQLDYLWDIILAKSQSTYQKDSFKK